MKLKSFNVHASLHRGGERSAGQPSCLSCFNVHETAARSRGLYTLVIPWLDHGIQAFFSYTFYCHPSGGGGADFLLLLTWITAYVGIRIYWFFWIPWSSHGMTTVCQDKLRDDN